MLTVSGLSAASAPVEIVERKGIGHPDTICDALAEEVSLALSRYYRDHFGLILHHNVDKALLWGGASKSEFGGGRVVEPMEIFLAGRATSEFKGVVVPIDELVIETSRHWLDKHLHNLDVEKHVKLHAMIRHGTSELVDLYLRQEITGVALANDTSCGVGYAPLDTLEQVVYQVERYLNSNKIKSSNPEIGEDIKIMGVRENGRIALTIGCAFVDKYVTSIIDYQQKKLHLIELVNAKTQEITDREVSVQVNTADGEIKDSLYLTVTGTSAEAGDDGEVGRGNRVNGLIAPYRPMNMEAAAGKNPVTHVGKLYNIVAQNIAAAIVQELSEVKEAQCYLVSRIGYPIHEPQVVDLRLWTTRDSGYFEKKVQEIVKHHLLNMSQIQDALISGEIKVY